MTKTLTVRDYVYRKLAFLKREDESFGDLMERLLFEPSQTFKAMRGNRVIAKGENLYDLAKKLKKMKVDPRLIRIISSKKLAPIVSWASWA